MCGCKSESKIWIRHRCPHPLHNPGPYQNVHTYGSPRNHPCAVFDSHPYNLAEFCFILLYLLDLVFHPAGCPRLSCIGYPAGAFICLFCTILLNIPSVRQIIENLAEVYRVVQRHHDLGLISHRGNMSRITHAYTTVYMEERFLICMFLFIFVCADVQ